MAGKSISGSGLPKVVGGNMRTIGFDSVMLTRPVLVHARESDAEAICEVAGLGSDKPFKAVGDSTAGLAGLASAGEDKAKLLLLLVTKRAFVSISVKLGFAVAGTRDVKERPLVEGTVEEVLDPFPFPSCNTWAFSIAGGSKSVAGIASSLGHPTSFGSWDKDV